MPIMLPAPGLFSTKNCWPNALEKCTTSTRATMSVPPPGGEGTTMRTVRVGDSCAAAAAAISKKAAATLTHRTARAFGGNEHKGDDASLRAAVYPVVHGVLLDQDISRAQPDERALHIHLDLAGKHDGVIDRLRAVVARRRARLVAHQPEHRAIRRLPEIQAFVARPCRD